jgi:nitrite reductase/ring-hydroxylating ferredoxin subunit
MPHAHSLCLVETMCGFCMLIHHYACAEACCHGEFRSDVERIQLRARAGVCLLRRSCVCFVLGLVPMSGDGQIHTKLEEHQPYPRHSGVYTCLQSLREEAHSGRHGSSLPKWYTAKQDTHRPISNLCITLVGWYCLCFARELVAGQVRHVHCLGLDIALYRGTSKPYAAHAIYSYCPHLGANIAVGGTVEGDCVVCPFHGWSFDSDGTCTRIPGLAQVPALAHTTSFIIVEKNGMVWLWHHAARQKPYFDVLDVPEMVDSRAWFAGQTEHTVACHITEIPVGLS